MARSSPVTGRGPKQQKHVYKEIFFAGFPASTSATNNELVQPFDGQFVHDFFHHYGEIEHFVYKDERGVGSVTFVSGDDAERFYLAVHLSILDCPVLAPAGGDDAGKKPSSSAQPAPTSADGSHTTVSVMLYLEFAQACPFSNPQLLLKDELLSGEMSRHALQSSAPPEGLTRTTAEMVVAAWQRPQPPEVAPSKPVVEVVEDEEEGTVGEKDEQTAEAPQTEGSDVTAGSNNNNNQKNGGDEDVALELFGPVFPGLPVYPVELQQQLWKLLRPSNFFTASAPREPMRVTVLDMWYEYYKTYVLHKTQPALARITDPELRFAAMPSLVQQIKAMQAQSSAADCARRLRRLTEDDLFHGALNYIGMLQKYKYDPVWASFMRDLYTDKVSSHVQLHMAEWNTVLHEHQTRKVASAARAGRSTRGRRKAGPVPSETAPLSQKERMAVAFAAQRHDLLRMRDENKATEEVAANSWAALGLFAATENLVENVRYLRLVRLGRVDKKTGEVISLETKLARKAKVGDETVDEDAYPLTGTQRQQDQFLFSEVTRLLDGYVLSGAATELLYLCEAPDAFRSSKGHIGYDELHHDRYTRRQYWLGVLNALWVPLILISLVVWGVQRFVGPLDMTPNITGNPNRTHPAPPGPRTRPPRPPPPPPPGATMDDLQASMRRAQELAKQRGGKFSIKMNRLDD